MKKKYNAWELKFSVKGYHFEQLSAQAQVRAIKQFNKACYLPDHYEPEYSEICASGVFFTKSGIILAC